MLPKELPTATRTLDIYLRALNLPMLVSILVMCNAFGRLHLWLPLCLGKACDAANSAPAMVPLVCSLAALVLLSFERTTGCWQESHWAFHRRTIVIGALAACGLLLAMILSGDVPVQHLAGITLQVQAPSLLYLAGLGGLTTWVLARCLVSAHAATARRPVRSATTYMW
jgi:hypothetical protein